jgi:ankyrin repeat protein
MVSIFNAIRQDNIDVLKHLIALTTGEMITATPSCITKESNQWIQQHWKQGSKQFDLNKRSAKGRTPLHCAATWNRVQMAQLLLECPQVDINIRDTENGWTALHR